MESVVPAVMRQAGKQGDLCSILLGLSFIFSSVLFTSTETVWTIKDGEPRTSTSTSTQLLSSYTPFSSKVAVYGHCDSVLTRY